MYEPNETAALHAFDYMSRALVVQPKAAQPDSNDDRVLDTLKQGPLTSAEIAANLNLSLEVVRRVVHALEVTGFIARRKFKTGYKYSLPDADFKPVSLENAAITKPQKMILDCLDAPKTIAQLAALTGESTDAVRQILRVMRLPTPGRPALVKADKQQGKPTMWEKITA
jgi:DNA-binding Lrp family transcriptional regulator